MAIGLTDMGFNDDGSSERELEPFEGQSKPVEGLVIPGAEKEETNCRLATAPHHNSPQKRSRMERI